LEKKSVAPPRLNNHLDDHHFVESIEYKDIISVEIEKRIYLNREQYIASYRDKDKKFHVAIASTEEDAIDKLKQELFKVSKYEKEITI